MSAVKCFDFSDEIIQVLDINGDVNKRLEPNLTKKQLEEMYYFMILTKAGDEKAIKLQRQGRMGTYAPNRGQEAAQVGSAYAMEKKDWMFPSFRELGSYLVRGIPLWMTYLIWDGNEEGERIPKDINNFTISIPVGSQIPHAVGASMAAKIKKDDIVVVVYFGDGATSEGDFHEGLNFAGVFNTPTVFICQNNQYAISVPRQKQSASKTLAQKAIAYGFKGIIVDGNDILAMYKVTKEALEHARAGLGPVLIEAQTYRLESHTTADDPTKYRDKKEVEEWKQKDPIPRFKRYLQKKGIWNKQFEELVNKNVKTVVQDAVTKSESFPKPKPEDMFDYVYAELPEQLKEQKEYLIKHIENG